MTSSTRFVAAGFSFTCDGDAYARTLSPPSCSKSATQLLATVEVVLDVGSSSERIAGTTTFGLYESAGNCGQSAT